jgi:hypothetical protein
VATAPFFLRSGDPRARRPTFVRRFIFEGCDTRELFSDGERRFGSDAFEALDPASESPELIESSDVLSLEHIPGIWRQTQTFNGTWAIFVVTRHLVCLLA